MTVTGDGGSGLPASARSLFVRVLMLARYRLGEATAGMQRALFG